MAERPNVYGDVWERELAHDAFAIRGTRVGAAAGAQRLGLGVFELPPSRRNMPYHAHYGIEELLIVLSSGADADVVIYPDSGKVGARGGGFGAPGALSYVLPTAAAVGYFDGEGDA
jgi:hypothetical protein